MKKLLHSALFALVICVAMSIGCFDGTGIQRVYASRAISSHNEQIVMGQDKVAHVEIMGARIEKEESAVDDKGTITLARYGFVDPNVNKINMFLIGESTKAAEGKVKIKAFTEAGQKGTELENNSKGLRTLDGEKINLSHSYDLPTKVKSVIVEFNYISSSATGKPYDYIINYYLEIY